MGIKHLTLREPSHQLQSPGGSQVDASAFELVAVEERRSSGGVGPLRHVPHLHGSASQLEAVQLLQSFLSTLCICKLTQYIVLLQFSVLSLDPVFGDDEGLTVMKP